MRPVGKPRYLLAIYEQGQWADAGVFGSAREVEIEQTVVVAQGVREGDVQIVQLKADEEPVVVVAQLKRAFVISAFRLINTFCWAPSNPIQPSRKPRFKQDADIEQVVRFNLVSSPAAKGARPVDFSKSTGGR